METDKKRVLIMIAGTQMFNAKLKNDISHLMLK